MTELELSIVDDNCRQESVLGAILLDVYFQTFLINVALRMRDGVREITELPDCDLLRGN